MDAMDRLAFEFCSATLSRKCVWVGAVVAYDVAEIVQVQRCLEELMALSDDRRWE